MNKRTATIKQLQGITLAAKADSTHWVIMDGKKEEGGSEAGPTPKELLLMALGGCTSMDVIPILKKKRTPVERYEAKLTATVRDEHPKIYSTIHIEYVFYGKGISPVDVERAIELSETKYCSVTAMLRDTVKITHSYRIEEPPAHADVP
ncbi:MAG: OsmC family protein [Bacteroidota bacterium]